MPLLPPGAYQVRVQHPGFRPMVRDGVQLEVDQRAELNFTLEVGLVSEQIEVRGAVSRLNTVEASQGQVIDNQRIVDMPLNGRSFLDLALMSGGAVQPAPGSRIGGFSSGGQRISQNNYIMDGIDNNSVELAAAGRRAEMVEPSIDAIQEFKVQTNSYAAEFGRGMGAVVNLTIKSGTNGVHGTAFEFVRNEVFDAQNFFTPAGAAKPPFKRNQFGFSLGGPVVIPHIYDGRNKTFFFGDFERTRIRQTSTIANTLPTLKMRTGDFSELSKRVNDPTNGQQFPGNIIPASAFRSRRGQDDATVSGAAVGQPGQQLHLPFAAEPGRGQVGLPRGPQPRLERQHFLPLQHPRHVPAEHAEPACSGLRRRRTGLHHGRDQHRGGLEPHFQADADHEPARRLEFCALQARQPRRTRWVTTTTRSTASRARSYVPDGGFSQLNVTGYRALGIGAE